MSEPLSDKAPGSPPEPDAQPPAALPVQGTAPAWEDPVASLPPAEQLAREARAREALRGFTTESRTASEPEPQSDPPFAVERGNRAMTGTAERIGSAVGNARREVRRRLELVRRPAAQPLVFPSAADALERANQIAREELDRASRHMQQIEEEIEDARHQAAHRLDQRADQASERFQQIRRQVLSRSRSRAQEFANAYPLQTIAAVAGVCFVFGVALRLRRPHRG